jgi:hypothetical protein
MMKSLWKLLFALALWAPLTYFHGWVVVQLWRWFITPLSADLPPPTVYAAVGIMFVIRAMSLRPQVAKEEVNPLIAAFAWPLMLLGAGWVWHWLAWGV